MGREAIRARHARWGAAAMSRWLRFYDDAINDPKILKLPEAMRWYWTAVLCIASKYEGTLPGLDDIALLLRVPSQKAASILTILANARLLDKTETGFAPHNWTGRQYKSDEPKATKGKDSYVYVIGHDWGAPALKIGFSKNPWARIVELQVAHHEKLSVLAAFKCKSHSEVDLHDLLKQYRKGGEWFSLPVSIYVAIHRASERSSNYESLVADLRELLRSATTDTDTDTETDTETDKSSEAIASGAEAPPDPSVAEREFFARGREILGKNAGGQLAKLKTAKGGNVALARAALETASTRDKPAEYVAGVIRNGSTGPPGKPLTAFQQRRQETQGILDELDDFATGRSSSGKTHSGVLPGHSGERPKELRSGTDGSVIDVSPAGYRTSG